MRTSNQKCRELVDERIPFKAHNLFGENVGHRYYVVYSYGHHWPMWVFDRTEHEWIGTDSKYSVSTSKQRSQSRPTDSTGCKLFHIDHIIEMLKI